MVELIYFGNPYSKVTLYRIVNGKRFELGEFTIADMMDYIQENYEYARLICGSERV